ncbi:MAG: hypothetical protein ACT4OX_16790 [Actinomycetota bacterium]
MSGEVSVVLVADAGSVPHRAVARLAQFGPELPPFAIIGGLAVITRLGRAHRATNDVDTVSDDQVGLVDGLVSAGFDRQRDSVLLEPDLKLDVIDVSEGDPDYVPYLTHRFAFDTRTQVDVIVRPSSGGPTVAACVSIARASALVAIKLAISEGVGRQRDPRKVGSDAFDVARLLQRLGPDALADELSGLAEPGFIDRVSLLATRHLVDEADRTTAAIVRSAVQGVEVIPAAQLEFLGRAFVERLSTRHG